MQTLEVIAGQFSPGVPGPLFPVVAKRPRLSWLRQGTAPDDFTTSLIPSTACSAGSKAHAAGGERIGLAKAIACPRHELCFRSATACATLL